MEGDQAELKAVMERETNTADVDTIHNCESLVLSVILFRPVYGFIREKIIQNKKIEIYFHLSHISEISISAVRRAGSRSPFTMQCDYRMSSQRE